MNFRNPKLIATIRIILGLLLLLFGVQGLYFTIVGGDIPGATENVLKVMEALKISGYIYVVKFIEILAGLMMLFNFKPAFAAVLFAPIAVAIVIYDIMLYSHIPAAMIPAFTVFSLNIYLGYAYWPKYAPLFEK